MKEKNSSNLERLKEIIKEELREEMLEELRAEQKKQELAPKTQFVRQRGPVNILAHIALFFIAFRIVYVICELFEIFK